MNGECDEAVKTATVLRRPSEVAFFDAILKELLCMSDDEDIVGTSVRLGKMVPITLLSKYCTCVY